MSAEPLSATAPIEHKLPEGWREVPLASVAEVRFSGVNKLSLPSEKPVRLCNYTDVYNNDYITGDLEFMRATATQPEIDRFGLQLGDVIITKDSETPDDIGIAAAVDYTAPDLLCGYHLALIRPRTEEVDPTFLAKQLRHHRLARYFGQQANGLTRYGLPTAVVANAPLWLPEPVKQRAIGAFLRLVDEAIAKTGGVVAKLKQVRAGLLHDLLTRGLDLSACDLPVGRHGAQAGEHGQFRDPIAHPEEFKGSPLGLIPRTWKVGGVRELARNCDARRVPLKQSDRDNRRGIYPYYGASGIIDYIDDYLFDGEFLLLAEDGENLRSRELPLAIIATGKFWVNNHAHILEPFSKIDIRFLRVVLEAQDYKPWLIGSAQPKLTQGELEAIPLKIPPPWEQTAIARILEAFDAQLTAEKRSLEKAQSLKAGLMSDLLTGRVRVPEGIEVGS